MPAFCSSATSLLGLGEGAGLEAFEVGDLLAQGFDLGHLVFLLGDEPRDGLFVDLDLVDLVANDLVKLGPDHMRVGVQHATGGVNLTGQQIADRLYPTTDGSEHGVIPGFWFRCEVAARASARLRHLTEC